jgi:hypothetical protein
MTAIRLLSPVAATSSVKASLRLTNAASFEAVVAQSLRRASFQMAPCPAYRLEQAVARSLTAIAPEGIDIETVVADALETLIVYGDILELHPLSDELSLASTRLVLRPSPPFFVRHVGGAAILVGVAGDEITALPDEVNERVRHDGALRILAPLGDEEVYAGLTQSGMPELSHAAWFRLPPAEPAQGYVTKWKDRLAATERPSGLEGLTVFEGTGSDFYPKRRVPLARGHNGFFVARRPQKYGADLWCLVDVKNGSVGHLLDLVSEGDRLRPCDLAWRILMAKDRIGGDPQRTSIQACERGWRLDFYSPLPAWAQRRMTIDGASVPPTSCLLSYEISSDALPNVAIVLAERLWLDASASTQEGAQ